MNEEYIKLLDLVFPLENPEMAEFRNEFEEYEPKDKIKAIAVNQETLQEYINEEVFRIFPQDHKDDYIMRIREYAEQIGYDEIYEFLDNEEWPDVIDEIEREDDEENEEFVDYCHKLIQNDERIYYLSQLNNMKLHMENLNNFILKNMI